VVGEEQVLIPSLSLKEQLKVEVKRAEAAVCVVPCIKSQAETKSWCLLSRKHQGQRLLEPLIFPSGAAKIQKELFEPNSIE